MRTDWTHAQPIDTAHMTDGVTTIQALAGDWISDEDAAAEAEAVNIVLMEQDEDWYEEPVIGWAPYTHAVAVGRWYADGRPTTHDEGVEWVWEHAWLVV